MMEIPSLGEKRWLDNPRNRSKSYGNHGSNIWESYIYLYTNEYGKNNYEIPMGKNDG